jgi:hypothetical protein
VARDRRARLGVDEHVARDRALRVAPRARRAAPKHCAHHTRAQGRADAPRTSRAHAGAESRTCRATQGHRGRASRSRTTQGPRRAMAGAGPRHGEAASGQGNPRRGRDGTECNGAARREQGGAGDAMAEPRRDEAGRSCAERGTTAARRHARPRIAPSRGGARVR